MAGYIDPETRRNEAQGPRAGVGFLARGSEPLPSVKGSGERCKLPQRGSARSPENLDVGAYWDLRNHVRTVN